MVEFRILGPLEALRDGVPLDVAGRRQRALLAYLLVHAGEVVSAERLVDELWGERAPPTAMASLQNAVGQLRRALGSGLVLTSPPGYLLTADPSQIDAGRFGALVDLARRATGDERGRLLREALALWRGDALADLLAEPWANHESERLAELRLVALRERIDVDLDLGRHAELVPELEALARQHPADERIRAQLMLALYRGGRQEQALDVYHEGRRLLVDRSGIEPGRTLQDLYRLILNQDGRLELDAVERSGASEHRRAVSDALQAGRLVPVLGPGVNLVGGHGNGHAGLPRPDELARRLAAAFACPAERAGSLASVAQYVAVTRGVGPLYDELHELLDRDWEPTPVHRLLAGLPAVLRRIGAPQPLIVTTNYDGALEVAFAESGEDVDVVSYVSLGRDRGRFQHRTADGSVRVITAPNAYAAVPLDERPVILKIHGEVDRRPARDAESFVVSEDDHIGYLVETGIAGVLPVTLAARLRRSHLLFLGYGVLDWSLRVFLHRLWPDEQPSYRAWAVQQTSEPLEREFWQRRGVEVVDGELESEVERLLGWVAEHAR